MISSKPSRRGTAIKRIARKHGTTDCLSKNSFLKLYRGGEVTRLPLLASKIRSAQLADDIKKYLRLPEKTVDDARQ
jgi:hypothetical protein